MAALTRRGQRQAAVQPNMLSLAAGCGISRVFAEAEVADLRLVSTCCATDVQLLSLGETAARFEFPLCCPGCTCHCWKPCASASR
jgi:hypothetical protein